MKTIKELCDFLLPHTETDLYIYSFFVCDTDWANAPGGKKVVEFSGEYERAFLRAFGKCEYLDWCVLSDEEEDGLSIGFVIPSKELKD